MKYLKTLLAVALAATAVMAIAGVGSASATVLCLDATCTTKAKVSQVVSASLEQDTTALVRSNAFKTECSISTIKMEVQKAGGAAETVSGPLTGLTFGGPCTNGCTVTVNALGTFEIHHIAASVNGQVISKNLTLTVNCGFIVCSFITAKTGTPIGTLTGSSKFVGATATLDVSAGLITEKGNCGSMAEWEGSYLVSTPDFLDVAAS
jgi:hypothetical protein